MDLSRIPEPARSKLQAQLDRLPAEVRATLEAKLANLPANQLEAVLAKTGPMLERLAGNKSAGKPSVSRPTTGSVAGHGSGMAPTQHRAYDQHDHFNTTVQRGDRAAPPLIVIFVLVAAVIVMLRVAGILPA